MSGIRAILFDCNGVIADDEPIHFKLFQKVLREEGLRLTQSEYVKRYLAMDDRDCFTDVLKRNGRKAPPTVILPLIRRKAGYYLQEVRKGIRIFPGVRSFVKGHRERYGMAVVSGALRHEIELILKTAGIRRAFSAVVSAEDVKHGKPDPACFLAGLKALNRTPAFRKDPLKARECVAIEDSIHGVESALKAGMRCIAVTNSYPKKQLRRADVVVKGLRGVKVGGIFSAAGTVSGAAGSAG